MGYGELLVGFEWWSHDSPPFLVLLFEVIVILLFLFPLYTKDYPRAHLVGWCVLYKLIWWWWLFLTGGTVCSSWRIWSMSITRLSCHLFWSSLVLLGFFLFVGGWVYRKGDTYIRRFCQAEDRYSTVYVSWYWCRWGAPDGPGCSGGCFLVLLSVPRELYWYL